MCRLWHRISFELFHFPSTQLPKTVVVCAYIAPLDSTCQHKDEIHYKITKKKSIVLSLHHLIVIVVHYVLIMTIVVCEYRVRLFQGKQNMISPVILLSHVMSLRFSTKTSVHSVLSSSKLFRFQAPQISHFYFSHTSD